MADFIERPSRRALLTGLAVSPIAVAGIGSFSGSARAQAPIQSASSWAGMMTLR